MFCPKPSDVLGKTTAGFYKNKSKICNPSIYKRYYKGNGLAISKGLISELGERFYK
ncbi:hypothetical protein PG637_07060 [Riemerella anatipestifer]|nr:hypothetical protein [Riemerella anatipestifer]MDY3325426.1 hypothetical protein [Riemerella anatipestifer]MDY3354171.1 hypothetical protein [Riemerella anatipestifer]